MQISDTAAASVPKLEAPRNSCDAHIHIFDTRVPSAPGKTPRPDAMVSDYKRVQERTGTTRFVVVTASNYGTNNQATTDAIDQSNGNARGVAVLDPGVTSAELRRLHDKGVRGIRITPVAPVEDLKILAKKVADLGWHVQFNIQPEEVVSIEGILSDLPAHIVFDHLARIYDVNDPARDTIMRLIDKGRAWVKLSGLYLTSKVGAPSFSDSVAVARTYVKAAPERMVWATDWPHPSAKVKPDPVQLFDLNLEWAPDAAMQQRILVSNPEVLYDFPKTV